MALAIGIAVHCDGCVAYDTKMAHQHGATREEVAETVALAVYMGGGPAAVYRRRCAAHTISLPAQNRNILVGEQEARHTDRNNAGAID
jgi:AhpD family alkylhydroperoxidase